MTERKPVGPCGVPPDQGAAVVVHRLEVGAGLARKHDVVYRERIVRFHRRHVADTQPRLVKRLPGGGNRGLRHVREIGAGQTEAQDGHADVGIL